MQFCSYVIVASCVHKSRKGRILTRPSVRTPLDQYLDRRRSEIEAHQRSIAPAPEPTYVPSPSAHRIAPAAALAPLPVTVTSAQPNPTVAVATVIEVVPQSASGMHLQAHEGHVIVKGHGGRAEAGEGWSKDKSLSEQLAELNHAKEAVRDSKSHGVP